MTVRLSSALRDALLALHDRRGKPVDFALPFEQAVFSGIRRKQRNALPADHVAARRHAAGAGRKISATRQRSVKIGRGEHRAEPVGENRA